MTGGASGIGLSISTLMAKEGAKVVIADFNEAGAK
ncbi:SDR family NAD(P)-dependent oxidoreductase [Peribacillus sp. YIM B13472]